DHDFPSIRGLSSHRSLPVFRSKHWKTPFSFSRYTRPSTITGEPIRCGGLVAWCQRRCVFVTSPLPPGRTASAGPPYPLNMTTTPPLTPPSPPGGEGRVRGEYVGEVYASLPAPAHDQSSFPV